MKLFVSPHNDDETLFGAFTILRENPEVLIVTDSKRQESKGISAIERKRETINALEWLGNPEVHFLGIPDEQLTRENFSGALKAFLLTRGHFEQVFAPAFEGPNGNRDHNLIAYSIEDVLKEIQSPPSPIVRYLTYTTEGKSRGRPVLFEREWPSLKLEALTCYRSQLREPSTFDHFLRDQYEYYA